MRLIGASLSLLGLSAAHHTADNEWLAWKSRHGISFKTHSEDQARYSKFADNREFVNAHNAKAADGIESYTVSLNKFAALDNTEFAAKYLSPVPSVGLAYTCPNMFADDGSSVPDAVTYTSANTDGKVWVTSTKDQGSCGSCWTFGAAGAVEGKLCKNGEQDCSNWTGISEQQMVDCASYTRGSTEPLVIDLSPYDNHGCSGGLFSNAFRYLVLNGGVNNYDDYTYVSGSTKTEGTCAYDVSTAIINPISDCGMVTPNDEAALKKSVAQNGVHSIGIDAGGVGFQLYSGGVYYSSTCSSTRLNHAVTLTGYGVDNGDSFWEVKNSWGAGWGVGGYIEMARDNGNQCGVAADTQWAI